VSPLLPVSPRSEEFIGQARDRHDAAQEALAAGHPGVAVSVAYYSMLYAARATLSEDDENARTHRGTWNLFRIRYVTTEAFDAGLFTIAQHAQVAREAGDFRRLRRALRKLSAMSPAPPDSSQRLNVCSA